MKYAVYFERLDQYVRTIKFECKELLDTLHHM
jgi:hypothetical protein